MKVDIDENGVVEITELFHNLKLKTGAGEVLCITMRDSGFEFTYQGKNYEAKEGVVQPFGGEKLFKYSDTTKQLEEVPTGQAPCDCAECKSDFDRAKESYEVQFGKESCNCRGCTSGDGPCVNESQEYCKQKIGCTCDYCVNYGYRR